jgi:hypothetical protein
MPDRTRPASNPTRALDAPPTLPLRTLTLPPAPEEIHPPTAWRIARLDGLPIPQDWTADVFTLVRAHCALVVQHQDDVIREEAKQARRRFEEWMSQCPM